MKFNIIKNRESFSFKSRNRHSHWFPSLCAFVIRCTRSNVATKPSVRVHIQVRNKQKGNSAIFIWAFTKEIMPNTLRKGVREKWIPVFRLFRLSCRHVAKRAVGISCCLRSRFRVTELNRKRNVQTENLQATTVKNDDVDHVKNNK